MTDDDTAALDTIAADTRRIAFFDDLRGIFTKAGAKAPYLLWSPADGDLINPLIAQFHKTCARMPQRDGRIRADDFDLAALAPHSDWLMILDVEGREFRYAYYGAGVAGMRGQDMTGHGLDDFADHIAVFLKATYGAVVREKVPLLTAHEPPRVIFAREWRKLIVPLFDQDRAEVVQLAALNVPDNEFRAGLEIIPDPVLILDADLIVRFANRSARETFGHPIYRGADPDMVTFTGIDLRPPAPPEVMAITGHVHDTVSLTVRDALIERFMLTLSGTVQFGNAFYVATLRPLFSDTPAKTL